MKPRLLDLFCGAGGCSMGYHRAGFEVVGVDIKFHKNYPFEFHQADAMTFPLDGFDVIHASPPCQGYSIAFHMKGVSDIHCNTIKAVDQIRDALTENGKPFIIENVPGAPLKNPITLSGMMFGLKIIRKRLFEFGFFDIYLCPTPNIPHNYREAGFVPYHHGTSKKRGSLPNIWTKERLQKAMGIDWMTIKEMTQAIPPAYTEFIGKQLMEYLK